jgi:hypothetical protein
MADKRIKDLAATASSPSGDDFIVIDGAANGTRRIDAEVFALDENVPLFPTLVYDGTNGATEFLYGDIPSSWKINNTDITQLYIGNSVTSIGSYAFQGCSNFTGNLTIGNSVTTIGSNAFRYCSGFTGNLTIGTSVTTIGSGAFRDCYGFTGDLTIGNSVTTIGSFAFYYCNALAGDLIIANSVTSIESNAFFGTSFARTIISERTTIPNDFARNAYLQGELVLPNNLTSIGSFAFYDCSGLTGNFVIPSGVTSIGSRAFFYCANLTGNIVLPNSVTTIGSEAFIICFLLTSAYLNQPIEQIGSGAFQDSGITNVYIGPDATGYTLGSGQTIGGKSGITVSAWTNYPNVP